MLPLGEDVPVGAAVLHGDAVAAVGGVVANGVEGAVLVVVGDVLQDRGVPHEAKVTVLHLRGGGRRRLSGRRICFWSAFSPTMETFFSWRSLTGFQIASGGFFLFFFVPPT